VKPLSPGGSSLKLRLRLGLDRHAELMEGVALLADEFDPLSPGDNHAALTTAIKQRVRNIIRSYNHHADILAEPIQNAVDEVEEAVRQGAIDRGVVYVSIDCAVGKVTVQDNGRGISTEDIRCLLGPDMTNKAELFRSGKSRGHKGVGLTFLAYGFNFFEIESRTETEHYTVRIENARQWIEDPENLNVPKAKLEVVARGAGKLDKPGTIVTVQVSDQTQPANLSRTFPSIEYAATVLETQTAIGVFPKEARVDEAFFDAELDYRPRSGPMKTMAIATVYRFPHRKLKTPVKTFDVGEYLAQPNRPAVPPQRLQKKHEAVYRFYTTDQLVNLVAGKTGDDLLLDEADVEALLRKHQVTAYALIGYSAAFKNVLADSWSVPENRRIIAPSRRVATDAMISSWQRDLSLSHRGFNVERIWLLFHLNNVESDLGRKDYPPEVVELLALLEDPVANDIAAEGAQFLITSSGSGGPIDYENPVLKAAARRANPLEVRLPSPMPTIRYLTVPKEEQDVIALFNEMRGLGILAFYVPVFFSSFYVYDSFFDYDIDGVPEYVNGILPGRDSAALPDRKRHGVAEFKFDAFDLILDIVREQKSWPEITWLVCWTAPVGTRNEMNVAEVQEGDELYAGVTHLAAWEGQGNVVHVISLKTLLEKLMGPGSSLDS